MQSGLPLLRLPKLSDYLSAGVRVISVELFIGEVQILSLDSKRSCPVYCQFRQKALGVQGLNNQTLSPTLNGFPQALLLQLVCSVTMETSLLLAKISHSV